MAGKKFYWIKLKKDFFDSLPMKRLRKLAGGATYTVIYLKLLLTAMENDGVIEFQGVDNSITEELALVLNEEEDDIEVCLQFLQTVNLAEINDNGDCFLPETLNMTGKESDSTARVRKHREKEKALQCNTETLQCNKSVTLPLTLTLNSNSNTLYDNNSNVSKDLNTDNDKSNIYNNIDDASENKKSSAFHPPTVEDVDAYCLEKGYEYVDPDAFIDFYSSKGWMVGKNKMKDWQAACRNWNRKGRDEGQRKYHREPKPEAEHTGRSKQCRQ